jgi:hypothetical protein
MARYRKVDVRVWVDEKFRRLTPLQPSGQALWLYLITNPSTTNIPGLYRAGEGAMAEELGWPLEAFREAFAEAFREGLAEADWKARVVWLRGGPKYNQPESPNVVKSWAMPWDEIPDCRLKATAFQHLKAFTEGLGQGFGEAFLKACRKPLAKALPNPDPDPEPEPETLCARARDPRPEPVGPSPSINGATVHPLPSHPANGITAYDLTHRFGMLWRGKYELEWAPDQGAAMAARKLLEDQIGAMPAADRAEALGDIVPAMERYLADNGRDDALAKARHPFTWFVARFNQYRLAAPVSAAAIALSKMKRFDPRNQPK